MSINRRSFLKLSAMAATATAFCGLGVCMEPTLAKARVLRIRWGKQTTTICPYCAVGCGLIVSTDKAGNGRALNVEGDPDHPINEGALCAKGAALWQLSENDQRVTKPLYRAPYSDKWEEVSWDWALDRIAEKVRTTREDGFVFKDEQGRQVNRCESIASVGSAALDNEECWLYQAFIRSLGVNYLEHQARICHSSTVAALAESFGRGAMTNHWIDIKNSDCILIMGSNAAECHPIGMKWALRARKERGAKIMHVDPRFTRTSQVADLHAYLRSGTDIAFLGGMIKYILDHGLIQKTYVVEYTNASFIVGKKFSFKHGMFSGFDPKKRAYDKSTWDFEYESEGVPKKDPTLQHPRCVYQLLKKHYSRYDLNTVSKVTGTPKSDLLKVYKLYSATNKPNKAGTIMYAMGWTQHSVGVQYIRTMAMVQLLLGNIGVAGGGVNALRGESNVQGSTDHCLLAHILPGYLGMPTAMHGSLAEYSATKAAPHLKGAKDPKSAAWWQNYPKYAASLVKAVYPTLDLEEGFSYIPKADPGRLGRGDYYWLGLMEAMYQGHFKGFFAWGQNPACGGANANKTRKAMTNLDWMVNVNIFDNETGSFWRGPGMKPEKIKTEVFFLPCAVSTEKEGSITNSGRWMQWRYQGPKPMGDTKTDGHIMCELIEKLQHLYKSKGGALAKAITELPLDMWTDENGFSSHKVAKVVNGFFLKDTEVKGKKFKAGQQVPNFTFLQDDGSTCSGNWLYSGSYNDAGNMAARRDRTQTDMQAKIGLYPGWTWCWPVNRRIIYNRASVDLKGRPFAPDKAVISWNGKKWVGDVPDGGWAPGTKYPFIMKPQGHGHIFGPGLKDGPFPEHYEPMECPVTAHPLSKQLNNPTAYQFDSEEKMVCDPRYPFVCSTWRVTEHWQTGAMTRWQPWLLEAHPQLFVELSEELAKLRGIANGEQIVIESFRGSLEAVAMVTPRLKPFKVLGNEVHQVGLPWCYGWRWPEDGGDSANVLSPSVGDPNTGIPETKAFMVNVRKA